MTGESTRRDSNTERDDDTIARAFVLVAAMGAGEVMTIAVPEQGAIVIGREAPADLVLADASISRRHARVVGGAPPSIEDLGSTNGTRVMGRTLEAGELVPIKFGTVIELGSVTMFVRAQGAGAEATDEVRRSRAQSTNTAQAIVRDPVMRRMYDLLDIVAPSRMSVLILGETGTGKEVYAAALHERSPRAREKFLRLNCAALPEALLEGELFGYEKGAFTGAIQAKAGLFESADGGTVFLDEVGEMPLATQAKLLRVLENGEVMRLGSLKPKRVDVRFISATNRDLEALATLHQFRADLFFRLNGVSVSLPPLRRRPDDIAALADKFLADVQGAYAGPIAPAAIEKLAGYRWPGNVRELKNVVERAALLARGGAIDAQHITFSASLGATPVEVAPAPVAASAATSTGGAMRDAIANVERERILEAMRVCGGNQTRAAKQLEISRTTLIARLEEYGYVRPRKT